MNDLRTDQNFPKEGSYTGVKGLVQLTSLDRTHCHSGTEVRPREDTNTFSPIQLNIVYHRIPIHSQFNMERGLYCGIF